MGTFSFGCVYKITNLINGKCYVGQTVQKPEMRWAAHRNKSPNPSLIYKAIQKHGINQFRFEVLCYADNRENLNYLEDHLIIAHNALAPVGYTCIGSRGLTGAISNETREKMSAAAKGRIPANKGKKMSLESRAKMSAAKKGKPGPSLGKRVSEETKTKMSAARKGRSFMSPEQYKAIGDKKKGVRLSKETKAKMSASRIGIVYSHDIIRKMAIAKTKFKIKRIDLITREEKIYECAMDLKADGFDYTSVHKVAGNKPESYRHTHRGFSWVMVKKD